MDPYEQVLSRVLKDMLTVNNCTVANKEVFYTLLHMFKRKVTDIANKVASGASHASRSAPCFFDLERVFHMQNIGSEDLLRTYKIYQNLPVVKFNVPETKDNELYKKSNSMLGEVPKEKYSHIPEYMKPLPKEHTFKSTPLNCAINKDYIWARERNAERRIDMQRNINSYYVRKNSTISLFQEHEEPTNKDFLLIDVPRPTRPAYMSVLMPIEQCAEKKIYETADISSRTLASPYFRVTYPSTETILKPNTASNALRPINHIESTKPNQPEQKVLDDVDD